MVRTIIDISPVIEMRSAVFPGDIVYRRKVSHDLKKGDHLTLSSIETTLHVGAHVDAPNHFSRDGLSIDQVDLRKYLGPSQVALLKKEPNCLIEPADLSSISFEAPRLLLKTGSCPDPLHYNTDFVALSARSVEFLAKRGIVLLGIDTPSIDPSFSKDLPAHRATLASQMAILEGLYLNHVEEGLYELVALPLRIKDADGSPVRAILRTLE